MSLVLAVRDEEGRYVLMADSATMDSGYVAGGLPKLRVWRGWLVGDTGSVADSYAMLKGIPADADVTDPLVWKERGDAVKKLQSEGETAVANFLLARGDECYVATSRGAIWPEGEWSSIGLDAAAKVLLPDFLHGDRAPEHLLWAGYQVMKKTEEITFGVRLPMIWGRTAFPGSNGPVGVQVYKPDHLEQVSP